MWCTVPPDHLKSVTGCAGHFRLAGRTRGMTVRWRVATTAFSGVADVARTPRQRLARLHVTGVQRGRRHRLAALWDNPCLGALVDVVVVRGNGKKESRSLRDVPCRRRRVSHLLDFHLISSQKQTPSHPMSQVPYVSRSLIAAPPPRHQPISPHHQSAPPSNQNFPTLPFLRTNTMHQHHHTPPSSSSSRPCDPTGRATSSRVPTRAPPRRSRSASMAR